MSRPRSGYLDHFISFVEQRKINIETTIQNKHKFKDITPDYWRKLNKNFYYHNTFSKHRYTFLRNIYKSFDIHFYSKKILILAIFFKRNDMLLTLFSFWFLGTGRELVLKYFSLQRTFMYINVNCFIITQAFLGYVRSTRDHWVF